jgi:hypothetical protein
VARWLESAIYDFFPAAPFESPPEDSLLVAAFSGFVLELPLSDEEPSDDVADEDDELSEDDDAEDARSR